MAANPTTPRLTLEAVASLHILLGGTPAVEWLVLNFIAARYDAKNLFYLPEKVASAIMERPDAFLKAAHKFGKNCPF